MLFEGLSYIFKPARKGASVSLGSRERPRLGTATWNLDGSFEQKGTLEIYAEASWRDRWRVEVS